MEKLTHVLIVMRSLNPGGIESFIVNLLENMDRSKLDIDVCIFDTPTNEETYYEKRLTAIGVKVIKLWAGTGKLEYFIKRKKLLSQYLKETKYDVVHVQGCFADDGWDCRIAKKRGVPNVIMHAHMAGLRLDSKTWRHFICHYLGRLSRVVNKYADHYWACSEEAGIWMYGKKAIHDDKFRVIYNGIKTAEYKYNEQTRIQLRDELEITDKVVIGNVGRFSSEKNQSFLIDIMSELQSESKKYHLLILGEGPLEQKLRDKIERLNLTENVTLIGNEYRASDIYNAMDLFVMPSLTEGFGIVAIEAQVNGLPCIISEFVPKLTDISGSVKILGLDSTDNWVTTIQDFHIGRYDTDKTEYQNYEISNSSQIVRNGYFCIDD